MKQGGPGEPGFRGFPCWWSDKLQHVSGWQLNTWRLPAALMLGLSCLGGWVGFVKTVSLLRFLGTVENVGGTSRLQPDPAPEPGVWGLLSVGVVAVPQSECVQRWPYSACVECTLCRAAAKKTKESRAVSPRMGFPPWWISALKRGRLGKGVSRGGKPRRGIQQYRHRPTRS
jgi:hypothetical protein